MKTSHTPGPWKQAPDAFYYITDQYGNAIAHTIDSLVPVKDTQANARLIAAAPELLDILKEIIIQEVDSAKHGIYGIASCLVAQAQEAIRKVEQS